MVNSFLKHVASSQAELGRGHSKRAKMVNVRHFFGVELLRFWTELGSVKAKMRVFASCLLKSKTLLSWGAMLHAIWRPFAYKTRVSNIDSRFSPKSDRCWHGFRPGIYIFIGVQMHSPILHWTRMRLLCSPLVPVPVGCTV